MKGKDLINIGIFSAIYFVIVFVVAMLGFVPILLPMLAVLVPLVGGVPFELFLTSVKKFGMIWIMSVIMGLLMLLTGMSWPPLAVSAVTGLIADLVFRAGNIRIDKRVHHEGKVVLPLSHYHGMTIGFVSGAAEQSLRKELPFLHCDLKALGEKFCPDNKEFLIRANEQLGAVFAQLYRAPQSVKTDYFRVKIAELLLLLSSLDVHKQAYQHQYFPTRQTEKIKQIHSLITASLDRTFTIEQLSEKFDMPCATLRKVFKAVYGAPIYQYIKSYKMKAAASMLISHSELNISDISQRLGYDNASKFSAAFRDVMGETPQNYRNRQEEI